MNATVPELVIGLIVIILMLSAAILGLRGGEGGSHE